MSKRGDDGAEGTGVLDATRVVGLCTVFCKLTGLAREVVITSLFGIGPVMDAFAYSCLVPAYFQAVVGGINGPLHTAVLVSLKKRGREKSAPGNSGKPLVEALSSWAVLPATLLAAALFLFPSPAVTLFAPGLTGGGRSAGSLEHALATSQLRIMSPCVITGVLTGIAFGGLHASGHFLSPSISPAVANVAMVALLLLAGGGRGGMGTRPEVGTASQAAVDGSGGATLLALAFLLGSLSQSLVQAAALQWQGAGTFFKPRLRLSDRKVVTDAFGLLIPATLSSTMVQLATYTDLWFASGYPGAASAMACAAILVTGPVGLLTALITVPRMPLLAQDAARSNWREFDSKCRDMARAGMHLGLPLAVSLVVFAQEIVKLVYERSAFTPASTVQVVPVLTVYACGISLFIWRDVLVRAFYAMGRGRVPAITSASALVANAALNAFLCERVATPAAGLVLSTVIVTAVSVCVLTAVLKRALSERLASSAEPRGGQGQGEGDTSDAIVAMAAAGIATFYAKTASRATPGLRALFGFPSVGASWVWDGILVGGALASTWGVYYMVVRASLILFRPRQRNKGSHESR